MYAALLMAGCLVGNPSNVASEAANRFGVDAAECERMWRWSIASMNRLRPVVWMNNSPITSWEWEEGSKWRRDCWDELDYVLRAASTEDRKLYHLNQLRRLLGEVDYQAGRMPFPVPNCKP